MKLYLNCLKYVIKKHFLDLFKKYILIILNVNIICFPINNLNH